MIAKLQEYIKFDPLNWLKSIDLSPKSIAILIAKIVIAIVIVLWSFWLSLPVASLKSKVISNITNLLPPGYNISIDSINNSLFGLEINSLKISDENYTFFIDKIDLSIFSFRIFILQLPLEVTAYGGNIYGALSLTNNSLNLFNSNISLAKVPLLRAYGIAGNAFTNISGTLSQNVIQGNFNIENLNIQTDKIKILPFKDLTEFKFNSIAGKFDLGGDLKTLAIQPNGSLTGNINVTAPWRGNLPATSFESIIHLELSQEALKSGSDLINLFLQPYIKGNRIDVKTTVNGDLTNFSSQIITQ